MKTSFDLSCIRRKNPEGYHYFISALTGKDTESLDTVGCACTFRPHHNPMNEAFPARLACVSDGKTGKFICTGFRRNLPYWNFTEADVQAPEWKYQDCCTGSCRTVSLWNLRFVEIAALRYIVCRIRCLGSWTDLSLEGAKTVMGTGCYTNHFLWLKITQSIGLVILRV